MPKAISERCELVKLCDINCSGLVFYNAHNVSSDTEIRYDTIVCILTCSKKLTGSQLSLPHEMDALYVDSIGKNVDRLEKVSFQTGFEGVNSGESLTLRGNPLGPIQSNK